MASAVAAFKEEMQELAHCRRLQSFDSPEWVPLGDSDRRLFDALPYCDVVYDLGSGLTEIVL